MGGYKKYLSLPLPTKQDYTKNEIYQNKWHVIKTITMVPFFDCRHYTYIEFMDLSRKDTEFRHRFLPKTNPNPKVEYLKIEPLDIGDSTWIGEWLDIVKYENDKFLRSMLTPNSRLVDKGLPRTYPITKELPYT